MDRNDSDDDDEGLDKKKPLPAPMATPSHQLTSAAPVKTFSLNDLSTSAKRVLTALVELNQHHITVPTHDQLALISGYPSEKQESFTQSLSQLLAAGIICYPLQGRVELAQPNVDELVFKF